MSVWFDEKKQRWVYKFWKDNIPYRQGGFKTKTAAKDAENKKRQELQIPDPEPTIRTDTASFLDLSNKYLDHTRSGMGLNTQRYKRKYIKLFIQHLQDEGLGHEMPADDLPRYVCTRYLDTVALKDGRKLSNRHLKDLKAMYNWGLKNDLVKTNPFRHIEPKGEDKFVKYVPPSEHIDRVLMAADQEEMDLIITIYSTGARKSEPLRLTWNDINLELGTITLWTRKRRGGGMEKDTMAMTDKLSKVMQRRWEMRNKESSYVFCRPDGSPYSSNSHYIRHLMARLCKKAGVKEFGLHAIRHRVAMILLDSKKASLGDIQRFLRHNRKTTTEDYLNDLRPSGSAMAEILNEHMEKNG